MARTFSTSSGRSTGEGAAQAPPEKPGFSRRAFLVRGSMAAGAATVVSSMPGIGGLLTTVESDSGEVGGAAAASGTELAPALSQPIVAHIVDLSSGEINIYQGTAQIVARSPGLAQALARLATKG